MSQSLKERYDERIEGVLSCYDRVVITGTVPQLAQEIGSQFSTRIEGTCVKHRFGKSSIKMYDKAGIVLRIETTTNGRLLLQAPSQGGTPKRAADPRTGSRQEEYLQPDRPA